MASLNSNGSESGWQMLEMLATQDQFLAMAGFCQETGYPPG